MSKIRRYISEQNYCFTLYYIYLHYVYLSVYYIYSQQNLHGIKDIILKIYNVKKF
jgi:hypothetical protein